MLSKYGFDINNRLIAKDIGRLTNQIWKLIPMRENDEPWQNQLDKVLVELVGLHEIFGFNDKYLTLLSNLEGLKLVDVSFEIYRSKVFESITLLRESCKDYASK